MRLTTNKGMADDVAVQTDEANLAFDFGQITFWEIGEGVDVVVVAQNGERRQFTMTPRGFEP